MQPDLAPHETFIVDLDFEAVPVQAWMATPQGDELVDGEAVAWSRRAVRVLYFDKHGREGYAWVWAYAVMRR